MTLSTNRLAGRVQYFGESVIRDMTRWAIRHQAVNLAQGMPDYDPPEEIKEAACKAIRDGFNQYAVTWGTADLRQAISEKVKRFNGIDSHPDRNITVCCGATECMMASLLAIINPGDEVIVFQPFYENYGPDGLISGAKPVWVHLKGPDWSLDLDELRDAFTDRTKAIIINTPNNPTGKVFTRDELAVIAELCIKHDSIAIADEIYEHIIYVDEPHVSIATLAGMEDRTITIGGLSKTFSMTGWRLGYCIAPEDLTNGIRKVHDFLTVGAAHPLQVAGAAAMRLPDSYFANLRHEYQRRRDVLLPYLAEAGFRFTSPDGAYYVLAEYDRRGFDDDVAFARWLVEHGGVATVPASSFYAPKNLGSHMIRFMFAKQEATLHEAGERLRLVPELLENRRQNV